MCYQKSQRDLVKKSENHTIGTIILMHLYTLKFPMMFPSYPKVLKVIKLFMEYSALVRWLLLDRLPGPLTPLGVE
jgi:hypothetical protein